jgi:hypothetical protein
MIARGAHAGLLVDPRPVGILWPPHRPPNITLIPLAAKCPELKRQEVGLGELRVLEGRAKAKKANRSRG